MPSIVVNKVEELSALTEEISKAAGERRIWRFDGQMGSGKTTLIKAICDNFGIFDTVNSPTFGFVNEYRDLAGNVYHHFDFYRLNSIEEALDIGVEEYLYSEAYCFLEWAERVEELLPADVFTITILVLDEHRRKIIF